MKTRYLIATIAVIGVAIGSTAAADTTEQRLIDYGFLPAAMDASEIIRTEPAGDVTASVARAAEYGFIAQPSEEVGRASLVRRDINPREGMEARLEHIGVIGPQLTWGTERDAQGQGELVSGESR